MASAQSPTPLVQRGQTIFQGQIQLGNGREWHSTPFVIGAGTVVRFDAESSSRFFAGMFSDIEYRRARQRSRLMFPFKLGSDQVAFHKAYNVVVQTTYRIVIRVSTWQRPTTIQLDVQAL